MRPSIPSIPALALAAGLTGGAVAEEEVTAWRLFVSDHGQPIVTVIDAVAGEVIATFDLRGPATLYRSDSGEAVYAVQGGDDVVATIATGIAFHDHGDHADIEVEAPRLTGAEIEGAYPVHFVEHGGQWAVFFDDEGVATRNGWPR